MVKTKQKESTLESSFSVVDGKVVSNKADQETCTADNAYILSALNEKGVSLHNYDYRVKVRKKTYFTNSKKESGEVFVYHYETEFVDFDYTRKTSFPKLSKDNLVRTHIQVSKAPTTCYIFTSNCSLNLICHYGLKQTDAMTAVIEDIFKKTWKRPKTSK